MFTGIIQSIGTIAAVEPKGEDVRIRVQTGKLDLADVQLGDSIAVNGVCLTAVELPGDGFWADTNGPNHHIVLNRAGWLIDGQVA